MATDENSGSGMSNRIIGLIALALGAVLLYIGIIDPLYSAAHGADKVSTYLKATIASPIFLAAGVAFAGWGDKAVAVLGTRDKPTTKGWIFYGFFAVVGLIAYVGEQRVLEGYGYVFH